MRRFFGLALLAVMLLATPVFAGNTIKIGEIATVTGDFAAYGVAEVEAVKMAVKKLTQRAASWARRWKSSCMTAAPVTKTWLMQPAVSHSRTKFVL